jgi:ABC-type sugar transport system ATPase subunit
VTEEVLRIENGVVVNNGQELLKRLNLQANKGEILGLISDNILEKQCILDLLNGTTELDSGWVFFEEKRIPEEAAQLLKIKVAVIESKSKLVNNLTVAENIFVVRGGFKKYFIHKKLLFEQAAGLISDFRLDIRPEQYVGRLTSLERCMVELIKAYATGHRFIVCSDFSGFLSSAELKKAFQIIFWLKKKGIGFILIENFDDVLFRYSDRLAVIHNGKTVRIFDKVDIEKATVYSLLMGEDEEKSAKEIANRGTSSVMADPYVFEIQYTASEQLPAFSFQIHKGEIINILYQEEESCLELLNLLKGDVKSKLVKLKLDSVPFYPAGIWDAIEKGVCFIEEDPISSMLFYDMSVMDNLIFTMSNKVKGLWLYKKYKRSIMKHLEPIFGMEILQSRMQKLEPVVLQQLAYSKWLLYLPKVIICKKPYSAVDVHMRQVTEELIRTYTAKGIAVIILTSNTNEAYAMGGRIVQLNNIQRIPPQHER